MRALISGVLHSDPSPRQTKSGDTFYTAQIKDDSTDPITWVSIAAFNETGAALAILKKGEAVAASGRLTVGTYQKGTETRASCNLAVDHLITLKRKKKPVPPKADQQQDDRYHDQTEGQQFSYSDDVPF